MMPIIRQSKTDKTVFYNTGHGHLGWTLGPYTGRTVTQLIKQEVTK
jgi:D-amino-acid dehydrogenase